VHFLSSPLYFTSHVQKNQTNLNGVKQGTFSKLVDFTRNDPDYCNLILLCKIKFEMRNEMRNNVTEKPQISVLCNQCIAVSVRTATQTMTDN